MSEAAVEVPVPEEKPIESVDEYQEKETLVLHPATDTHEIEFGEGRKVRIRPLPDKYQKQLRRMVMEVFTEQKIAEKASAAGEGVAGLMGILGPTDAMCDILHRGCALIADFYKIPGATPEWISENLDDGQMYEIVTKQLEHGTRNTFSLGGVLLFLRFTRATCAELSQVDLSQEVKAQAAILFGSPGKLPQSPASAKPGASPQTSSPNEPQRGN